MSGQRSFVDWQTSAWLHSFYNSTLLSWQMWCQLAEFESWFPFLHGAILWISSHECWWHFAALHSPGLMVHWGLKLNWSASHYVQSLGLLLQTHNPHYLGGTHYGSPMSCLHWSNQSNKLLPCKGCCYVSLWVTHGLKEFIVLICWAQDWCCEHAIEKDQGWCPI